MAESKKDAGTPEAAAKAPELPKDPYWDDSSWVELKDDAACPEGFWALFPGPAPGKDAAERKENEGRRKELAAALMAKTFTVKLRGPSELTLGDYDPGKARYPVKVKTSVDCKDSIGSATIAWAPAKVPPPQPSVVQAEAEVTMRVWQAEPIEWQLAMKSMSEAKAWADRNRLSLSARVAFKLGKTQVDHKYLKTSKVAYGDIAFGGGKEDWGAGRMVQADSPKFKLVGEMGKETLLEMK